MANPFDQFDAAATAPTANPFDQFDASANPFDRFDDAGNVMGVVNAARRAGRGSLAGLDVMGAMARGAKRDDYLAEAERLEKQAAEIEQLAPSWSPENRRTWADRARSTAVTLRERAGVMDTSAAGSLAQAAANNAAAEKIPLSEDYRGYQQAEGWEAVKQFLKNPVEIPLTIAAEGAAGSVPAMAAGAVGAATAGAPGLAAGSGLGSFATEYAASVLGTLSERGVDIENASALRAAFADPQIMAEARKRGLAKGIPVAIFDAISGGIAGRTVAPALKQTLKQTAKAAAKEVGEQAALGMAGEATGQSAEQIAATGRLDPSALSLKDIVAEGIGEVVPGAGQVATGALLRGDTGQNKPERPRDLRAQQRQLERGERAVQMFPLGTDELPLPQGMERVETPRGVFHFDPRRMTADDILSKSQAGRENELLGLGPYSKPEIDARVRAGEPAAVIVERGPNGEELRGAVVTPSTAAETGRAMQAAKSPGSTLRAESVDQTLAARTDDLENTIGASLPDDESRDVIKGRSAEATARELGGAKVDFAGTVQSVRDALLAKDATPAQLDALDFQLRALEQRKDKRRLKPEQVNASLANTFLMEALPAAEVFPLVSKLSESSENIAALRAGIAELRGSTLNSQPSTLRSATLTPEQRAQKAAELRQREEQAAEAKRQAEAAREQQRQAAADAEKQKAAARAMEKKEFRATEAAGVSATGGLDYARLPEARLTELAEQGDQRAAREIFTRAELTKDDRESLVQAVEKIKLPLGDRALGAELQSLIQEEMTPQQRKKLTAAQASDLDYVAQALRERGFSQIKTPADVIDHVQRALRGEDIRADAAEDVPFARREQNVRPVRRAAADLERATERWWENFRIVAPAVSRQVELRFGQPEDLVASGDVDAADLTGEEEAVYIGKREGALRAVIHLFERALQRNTEAVTRLNLLHEIGHYYYDLLDPETQGALRDQWRNEIDGKTGPLFDAEGSLRPNVALGVDSDVQEWFAERLAHANDAWAKRRLGVLPKKDTLIRTLAAELRKLLLRLREYIERAFGANGYSDALTKDFRAFLDQGDRWGPAPVDEDMELAGAFAKTGLPFSRREQRTLEQLMRDYASLERTRDRYVAQGDTVPRHVLTGLADLREELDNAMPDWREQMKAMPAAEQDQAADQTPGGEEPGVSVGNLFGESEEISPEATAAKRSQLEASTIPRPNGLKHWLSNVGRVFTNFKSAIPELPNGAAGRVFMRFRQGYRMMKAATEAVRKDAEERVAHVLEPLSAIGRDAVSPARYRELQQLQEVRAKQIEAGKPVKKELTARIAEIERELEQVPYHLFRKIVLYRDLFFRSRLIGPAGEPIQLPFALTKGEIETTLRQLHATLNASEHKAALEESLKRHYRLVKDVRDGLLERGYIIPEELRNPVYFPHLLIEKTSGGLQRVKLDTAEDFRGYLQTLVGSAKAIESDYLTAMYYHLATVEAHNARQDIVEKYWQPYDIAEKLKAEAKAMNDERRAQGLGPISWKTLVPKDHTIITVDDRIPVRPEYIINRQVLAERLGVALGEGDLQAQLRELGMSVTLTADDFQAALAAGERQQWVVPKPVAEALRGIMARDSRTDGLVSKVVSTPNSLWKRWTLFAPHTTVRYNYGNLVSDIEKLFSADPAVFRQLRPAFREVRAFYKGDEASADLKEAFRRGVIDGVTAGEVTDLAAQQMDRFEAFLTSREKFSGMMKRGLGWGVTVSRIREAAFRYAKFRADLERMREGAEPIYAGAYNRDVRAISEDTPEATQYARAAEIARKTFGDYGDISVSGDAIRKYLMPFYSWTEVNFRYHANLFRNLGDLTAGAGAAQLARQMATAASRVLVARSVTGVLLRLALPYVAASLWNNSGDREELEKTLSEEDRRRFHIIVGKDAEGRTQVIYAPTALSDFMRWFGGNQFAMLAGKYARDEITFPQLVHEWVGTTPKDVFNNAAQSVGPIFKAAWVSLARKNPFPDVLNQRSVPDHDLAWTVLGTMVDGPSAEGLRTLLDRDFYTSRTQADWALQLLLQTRLRDPEQWGYYATLDRVAAYQEAHGGTVDFGVNNRADAQLLTSFRRAIRAGDVRAAVSFYQRLLHAGYTAERFAASVRASDPLGTLKKDYRKDFVDNLSEAERLDLTNAYKYAQRLQVFQRREKVLFPREKATPTYRQRFAEQGGRPDVFAGIMLDLADDTDEEKDARADVMLRKSLRR